MHRVIVGVLVLASLALSLGRGGETPPAKPNIEQLIEQLDDKDFRVRKAAEEAIEKIGPEALPALRKALEAKPPLEVTRRLEKWIPQFELVLLSEPERITLDVKEKPLQEIIELIAKQSGHTLDLQPNMDMEKKPYDFKFDRVTFWEAIDAVCEKGEMVASRTGDGKGLQLHFSDQHQPYVSRHGAFRVVAQSFQYSYSRQRDNQLGMVPRKPAENDKADQQHESESLQFNINVEAEPSMPVLGYGQAALSEASDDKKQNLVSAGDNTMRAMRVGLHGLFGGRTRFVFAGGPVDGWLPMKPSAKDAIKVVVIKGTIPVHLEKEKKTEVLVEKLPEAKGKKFKMGQEDVEITEFKEIGNQQYELHMTVTGGKGQDADGDMYNELALRDRDGKRCRVMPMNIETNFQGPTKTTKVQVGFGAPNGDIKLVCTTRIVREFVLPFEFRDLPLP